MTAHQRARALLTKWSEQEGCTVISRYEGDRWDKLVDLIAADVEAVEAAARESAFLEAIEIVMQSKDVESVLTLLRSKAGGPKLKVSL